MRSMVFVGVVLGALVLWGCPAEEPPQTGDAGADTAADAAGPLLEARVLKPAGMGSNPTYEPFDGPEPTLEIVSGPQGGYHVEVALQIEEPSEASFITVVSWSLSHAETGDVLSRQPSSLRIDDRGWERGDDGELLLPRYWLVLDIVDAADVEGETVQLDVELEVEGGLGHGSDSVEVELVDEVDEAMPG